MNLRIVCSGVFALLLAGSAIGQSPIEPPTIISPATSGSDADEETVSASEPDGVPAKDLPRLNEFLGDEIGLVFRTLARQAKMNIVVSDKVPKQAGTVTVRLEDKSPKEAIQIIVQMKGLVMDEVDGVYYIKTAEEEVEKMPASRLLDDITKTTLPPLARLKGEYYKQLVQSGVPESTAATILLNEELSKAAFDRPENSRVAFTSQDSRSSASELPQWFAWSAFGSLGLELLKWMPMLVLHFIFAISVWATARRAIRSGMTLTFFSPFFWGFATFVGGVVVAGLYWLMHHSSIGARNTTAG